jgi:hypothetical protein
MEGEFLVIRPRQAWLRQANEAMEVFRAIIPTGVKMREWVNYDRQAFVLLVEALYALVPDEVDPELVRLADLRPVGEVVEGGMAY